LIRAYANLWLKATVDHFTKGTRTSKQLIRLTKPNNSSTDDAVEYADILNNHFHKQFNSGHQLQKLPKANANGPTTYIKIEGVKKLLADLKMEKLQGQTNYVRLTLQLIHT